ncbi:MAG: AAA family ATPase [Elainellaceae cyanobacterium]
MINSPLLETFQTAYQNLQLLPLLKQEDLDKFWVEYGTNVIDELEQLVYDSAPGNDKIIFTGHRGCGKSTLLAEFCRRVDDDYFVVMFSIAELIELSDVNHVNILFAIAVQLMESAEDQNIKIKASTKKAFYRWFGEQTRLETSTIEADIEAKYEAGGGLTAIIKFFAQIKTILRANAIIRDEIKTKFARQISDLIDQINTIAATIEASVNKPILVVIDDLDKLDLELVESIYRNNINPLFQPQFGIIYTIPIAAIRNLSLRNVIRGKTSKIQFMRVAKFFPKGANRTPNAEPMDDSISVFRQILRKRIPSELIESEIEQQIILDSGGVLRELIRLASRCCAKCLIQIRRATRKSDPS